MREIRQYGGTPEFVVLEGFGLGSALRLSTAFQEGGISAVGRAFERRAGHVARVIAAFESVWRWSEAVRPSGFMPANQAVSPSRRR